MGEVQDLNETIAALQEEVISYKKLRDREKKAREEAEDLLEVKSRELSKLYEESHNTRARFRNIFENAVEGIYQITPDGEYLWVNPRLVKIRGYDSFRDLRAGMRANKDGFYVEKGRREAFKRLLEDNEFVSGFESQIRQKNGDVLWISENARIVRDDLGNILYYEGTIQDITPRRMAQEALEKNKEELELANRQLKQTQSQMVHQEKMAGLGQLAAGVAHEINNPVGFIMSNLGTLREYVETFQTFFDLYDQLMGFVKANDGEAAQKCVQEIEALKVSEDLDFVLEDLDQLINESADGANRVKDIVLGLRNFARLDEAEVKEADINEGIESTLKVIWNAIKYKAEVAKDFGELPKLICYPAQLNQVFMNLLTNAAQAMEEKGEIQIRTRLQNDHIVIDIEDNGKGIPPEHLDKLFDPFFTTKPVGKGTGLGLAISHGIIEKHKGTISVQSKVGHGTVFTISLPVVGGVEEPEAES